ncbi:biotin synthase BioB [Carboxylicivirga sp. N1Y90]|uniref:biotin synthase BioB n=1 Tax=Carboxylicivirga fragile TaxID=3417571 RepID=UPI003D34A884|nr:biotin synthase BioB [Marinilabiliaceae bacterium N1Y90]
MVDILLDKVLSGGQIGETEALQLLKTEDKEKLYEAANTIRKHFKGNEMEMCSILNAKSGKCTQDCKWCSQSMFHNTDVEEYELVDLKLAEKQARENADQGVYRFSLVTSGRSISNRNLDELCGVYRNIQKNTDIHLCASMGLLNRSQLEKLKASGVEHYHCNIETAPSYFKSVVTSHTIEEKYRTIRFAQELGMGVCSGGIIGMGETMKQRIEMALTLRDLKVVSIPINILMPVEGTGMSNYSPLSDEEVLTTFALFRFINPMANIRLAGGRNLISHIQDKALKSGVSAALVGDYLTTIGTNIQQDKAIFDKAGFSLLKDEKCSAASQQ